MKLLILLEQSINVCIYILAMPHVLYPSSLFQWKDSSFIQLVLASLHCLGDVRQRKELVVVDEEHELKLRLLDIMIALNVPDNKTPLL